MILKGSYLFYEAEADADPGSREPERKDAASYQHKNIGDNVKNFRKTSHMRKNAVHLQKKTGSARLVVPNWFLLERNSFVQKLNAYR